MSVLGTLDAYVDETGGRVVTLADVEAAVAGLPLSVRRLLARGPIAEGCRVCRAVWVMDGRGFPSPATDLLADFHAQRRSRDDSVAPEDEVPCYLRCLLIYLCAGWDGVHE